MKKEELLEFRKKSFDLKVLLSVFAKDENRSDLFKILSQKYNNIRMDNIHHEKTTVNNIQSSHRIIQEGLNKLADAEYEILNEVLKKLESISR